MTALARSPIVLVGLALLITAGFWFGLYSPARDQTAAAQQQLATLEAQEAALRAELEKLRQLEAREEEFTALSDALDRYIPRAIDQPRAYRELATAAARADVDLIQLNFTKPEPVGEAEDAATTSGAGVPTEAPIDPSASAGDTLVTIPLTMVVDGTFTEIVDMFRRIEDTIPRAVLIESISVNESGDEGFPELSVTWDGKIFALIPPSEIPVGGSGSTDAAPPTDGATPAPTESPAS